MTENLPVFGPTQVHDVEGITADVVVRTAVALSRDQLVAACGLAFTDLPEIDPSTAPVDVIRAEIEGHMASQAILDVDDVTESGWIESFPREHPERWAQLLTAVERAYPRPPAPMPRPGPRYFDGQVMVATVDRGPVVVDEPAWCIGHDWQKDIGRNDITHRSTRTKVDVTTESGSANLLSACISWAPFTELIPVVSVELDQDSADGDYQAEEIRLLAEGLRTAARRLERLAAEAISMRRAL